jgi:hypothetical protein
MYIGKYNKQKCVCIVAIFAHMHMYKNAIHRYIERDRELLNVNYLVAFITERKSERVNTLNAAC